MHHAAKAVGCLHICAILLQEGLLRLSSSGISQCYSFIAISAINTASTHDSASLAMSSIGRFIQNGKIPRGYGDPGDDVYSIDVCLMTPFRKAFLSAYPNSYNVHCSSLIVHIQQIFGMLVKLKVFKSRLMFPLIKNS